MALDKLGTHPPKVPRPPRPRAPGLYHLTVRSTTPDPLFRDGFDRLELISQLARTTAQINWTCIAVCLMTTHYHLVVDAGEGVLPEAMKRINWPYAMAFNKRHGRRGHAVGGKYASIPILDEGHLLNAYRYVVRNPVKAGLCAGPEEWPWSSYAATIGHTDGFSFVDASIVLETFDAPVTEIAIERLRGFSEADWS